MTAKRRKKSRFKKFIFLCLIIAAAVISFFAVQEFQKDTSKKVTTETSQTQNNSDSDSDDLKTESEPESEPETSVESAEETIKETDASDPNLSESVTGSVTKAIFTNDNYRIAVTTDQALSEGNCELSFVSSEVNLSASAQIVAHPNSSSCTFNLPASEVKNGFYDLKVVITTTQNRSGIIEDRIEVSNG